MAATIGDIINLLGSASISFNEDELRLCKTPDGEGNWFSVLDISPTGLYMSNGEMWEFSKLTQGERELVYQECKDVILSVLNRINSKMPEL